MPAIRPWLSKDEKTTVPVVLCIDVEPDARLVDPRGATPWQASDEAIAWLSAWRATLQQRTARPVHFNWFVRLDPQIDQAYGRLWPIEHYRRQFEAFHAHGDTIGIHPHAWRWDAGRHEWFADNGNQSWVDHCVRSAVAAFTDGFQRRPQVCRLGDRGMSNATMALLEGLGIAIDLTVEAGMPRLPAARLDDRHTADLPDYRRVPRRPYRPSRRDFRRPAWRSERALWVMPISTGRVRVAGRWRRSRRTLNLAAPYAPHIIEQRLSCRRPLLVITGRSGDLANPHWRAAFRANLDFLASHPRVADFAWCTAQAAVAAGGKA